MTREPILVTCVLLALIAIACAHDRDEGALPPADNEPSMETGPTSCGQRVSQVLPSPDTSFEVLFEMKSERGELLRYLAWRQGAGARRWDVVQVTNGTVSFFWG